MEISELKPGIIAFYDLISVDDIKLINYFIEKASESDWNKFNSQDPNYSGHWDNRVLDLKHFYERKQLMELEAIQTKVGDTVLKYLGKQYRSNDGIKLLLRALPGHSMNIHIDDDSNGCKYGIVGYLNDDYEGGELVFPELGITVNPKEHNLILFPSYFMYKHEVKPVISGTRYSLVTWLH